MEADQPEGTEYRKNIYKDILTSGSHGMQLSDAGFYSNPLPDALDTCACVYCDVQLDGWSKDDDPESVVVSLGLLFDWLMPKTRVFPVSRTEHQRRQPNCYFFTSQAKKGSRVVGCRRHESEDTRLTICDSYNRCQLQHEEMQQPLHLAKHPRRAR